LFCFDVATSGIVDRSENAIILFLICCAKLMDGLPIVILFQL